MHVRGVMFFYQLTEELLAEPRETRVRFMEWLRTQFEADAEATINLPEGD